MSPISLFLLGMGTGTYGVIVGAGGGIVIVPLLLVFSDMQPQIVAGTSLALVSVNSISGTLVYRRLGLIDYRSGFSFAVAAIPGSVIAPLVLKSVSADLFQIIFGFLLIITAIHILVYRREQPGPSSDFDMPSPRNNAKRSIATSSGETFQYGFNGPLAIIFNVVLGFISAFFGTGGGFLRMPVLVAAFSFPVRVAAATSIFALSISASVGTLIHSFVGQVDWYPVFVWTGLGLLLGGQIGARLAPIIKVAWIVRMLVLLLLAMGMRVIFQGFWG